MRWLGWRTAEHNGIVAVQNALHLQIRLLGGAAYVVAGPLAKRPFIRFVSLDNPALEDNLSMRVWASSPPTDETVMPLSLVTLEERTFYTLGAHLWVGGLQEAGENRG